MLGGAQSRQTDKPEWGGAVTATPGPAALGPSAATAHLLWNVCSRVCMLTQGEEAINAVGAWPSSTKRGGPQFSCQS